jgi:hypothetical protein
MSDFDEVLERLVGEPQFAAALAADPQRALAGYRLSDDEVALLHTQVGGEAAAEHGVEARLNQSSTFGMLSPLVGMFGGGGGGGGGLSGIGDQPGNSGLGPATGGSGGSGGSGGAHGFGPAGEARLGQAPVDAYGSETYAASLGRDPAEPGGLAGLDDRIGEGLLAADTGDTGLGAAPPQDGAGRGDAPQEPPAALAPPEGYRTRVDVDGDGEWDRHVAVGRADGGVDIYVDADGDGRVDFVGHDDDADRRVDSAQYDKDGDGYFEKRMYDDDGDGWMDRTVYQTPPQP